MLADVSITKTNGQIDSAPGETVAYVLTVANAGPSAATNVNVVDTLNAEFAGATWTCAAASGATCPNLTGTGSINETIPAVGPGATVTYTLRAQISTSARGSVTNTATVTSNEPDPDTSNGESVDTDTLTPKADLRVTKTDGSVVQSLREAIARQQQFALGVEHGEEIDRAGVEARARDLLAFSAALAAAKRCALAPALACS